MPSYFWWCPRALGRNGRRRIRPWLRLLLCRSWIGQSTPVSCRGQTGLGCRRIKATLLRMRWLLIVRRSKTRPRGGLADRWYRYWSSRRNSRNLRQRGHQRTRARYLWWHQPSLPWLTGPRRNNVLTAFGARSSHASEMSRDCKPRLAVATGELDHIGVHLGGSLYLVRDSLAFYSPPEEQNIQESVFFT